MNSSLKIRDIETIKFFFLLMIYMYKKRYFIAKVLIFCVVKIVFLSYNCSLLGSFPPKNVFTIFYICKVEKTYPITAALVGANRFILFYRKRQAHNIIYIKSNFVLLRYYLQIQFHGWNLQKYRYL